MGTSGVNWSNVPHETIVDLINGGAGVGPVNAAADSYRRMAITLRQADSDLRAALGSAGASWEGHAASEMQTASTPLASWAEEADQLAAQTGSSTEVFGQYFASTRTTMPPPVKVPSTSWVDDTGLSSVPGVTTDHERAEAAADAAHQEAARKMEAYDDASYDTVRTQYFSPPPTVVLEVPPPTGTGGQQVGTASTTAGARADSTAYTPSGAFAAPGAPAAPSPQTTGGSQVVAAPGSPTSPSWAGSTPAVPGGFGGGLPPGGGGYPGYPGGIGSLPPPIGAVPGGGFGGGSGSGGGVRPGVPGQPGGGGVRPGAPARGFGTGEYGRGFGPGGAGGFGGAGGPGTGGAGGNAGFGTDGHGQRGFNPAALVDADGRPGGPGRPGAGGGLGPMGAGARGEEDAEHKRPDYLIETEDVWGDGARVAPPVIGERPTH